MLYEVITPETLYAVLAGIAEDTRVEVVQLSPWPDRAVRASRKATADL